MTGMLQSRQLGICCPVVCGVAWLWRAVIVLLIVRSAVAEVNFRGVAPEDQKFYSSSTIWCKDGSISFPSERLNDDFCDCMDGTDEPGTSACPDGQFYCENKGYVSSSIFSSRVNDGICDCCDGSDEYQGKVKCVNTCWEAGKMLRGNLRRKISTLKEGLIKKNKDIELAKQLRAENQSKLLTLRREEKILSDAAGKLKAEKEAVEKAEKEEQLEKEKQEKAEREKKEKENPTSQSEDVIDKSDEEEQLDHTEAPVSAAVPTVGDTLLEDEISNSLDYGQESDLELSTEEDKGDDYAIDAHLSKVDELAGAGDESSETDETGEAEDLENLSKEELGKAIASRWTGEYTGEKGTTHSKKREDGVENASMDTEDHHDYDHDDDEDYDQVEENIVDNDAVDEDKEPGTSVYEKAQDDAVFSPFQPTTSSFWSKIRDKAQALLRSARISKIPFNKSDADWIRNEFNEVSSKLRDVHSQIADLERKLKQDLGKDGEYYTMYEKCFERKQNKYTYKVCPFKDATQLEGHASTRLGSWHGFQDGYAWMTFESGDRCWNGPDRSLRIRLRCGPKIELQNVDEPSRCEYVADLSTPAACREERLQALEQELHAQSEVPELHEEL